jgi:acetamidase/formamidase
MNKPVDMTTTTPKTHLLQSTPETVHWGYFDGGLAPVLTIDSGDRVVIECVSGNPERNPSPESGLTLLPDLKLIQEKAKKGTGNHMLTGPIAVKDAKVGDVLEVRILDIELRQNWGYNMFRPYVGTLPDEFPYSRMIHIMLDKATNMATMPSGLQVPMAPFFGQLAVQPPKANGRQNSKEPREFGGNIDCKDLVAGSTIYFPVWNDGGLFSTGDGHAAQGHGEVDGTAIETCLKGTFEFHVRKDLGWKLPRGETPTHIIAFGLDPDLDDAARIALKQLIDWIVAITGIGKDEAYALCSVAADLHVTQTVNHVKGVHAMIAKSILQKP